MIGAVAASVSCRRPTIFRDDPQPLRSLHDPPLIGVWRMDVPMSATAPRAASTTASSCTVRGNCQARSPKTSSQPNPSSALMVSGGSSRGAKIRTFGLDMQAPWQTWA